MWMVLNITKNISVRNKSREIELVVRLDRALINRK